MFNSNCNSDMYLHEQEDILFEEWKNSYPSDVREKIVIDGLCHNGVLYNESRNSYSGNEEELWATAKRKILFLMKDPNSNPGEDYREWHWREITAKFFKVIFNWLQGLSEITPDYIPLLENDSYLDPANQVVLKYPLAIVNVKKISGSSSVLNNTLYDYAKRDAPFLRRQVRDILQHNIVVCGGGSGSVLNIAKQYIYPDLTFKPINNWCFFSEEQDLLLINSWHPSAIISDTQKIDDMMRNVADFINKTQTNIFR